MQAKTPRGDAEGVYLLDPATGLPYVASGGRLPVEPLGIPGVARQVATTTMNANTALTVGVGRISIFARIAPLRYSVGGAAQTANAATSHYLAAGERIERVAGWVAPEHLGGVVGVRLTACPPGRGAVQCQCP